MKQSSCRFNVFALFALLVFLAPVSLAAKQDARQSSLRAMQTELERSQQKLKLDDFETPYFISYQMKTYDTYSLLVKYGSLYRTKHTPSAELYVEVRVGDYQFDNTGELDPLYGINLDEGAPISQQAPIDGNLAALRNTLWLLTDSSYKEALAQYQQKKSKAVYLKPNEKVGSFSKQAPAIFTGAKIPFKPDMSLWKERLVKLSRLFLAHPEILQSELRLTAEKQVRYYVNTEGSRIVDETVLYSLSVNAETRAEDDMVLLGNRAFYGPDQQGMPSFNEMKTKINEMIGELLQLRHAPLLDPYTGPAILSPQATGVLFHEAIGHRLEGERMRSDEEGHTFKGQVGSRILPEFLNLIDDPTIGYYNNHFLAGKYAYDEEGVAAQKVTLIDKGTLTNLLMSRSPIEGFPLSNGHGRSSGTQKPMSRMSNLLLQSDRQTDDAELKRKLIELVVKQGKPYGLLIEDMEGGQTNTSSYGYQAFKVVPHVVRRIFPDGREELVRGVELVGTPLTSINKIVLTGKKMEVFNGFCGAESGYVPVSTVSPAVLVEELEIQRKRENKSRSPILPSPLNEPK